MLNHMRPIKYHVPRMTLCATNRSIFPRIYFVLKNQKNRDISSEKRESGINREMWYFPPESGNVDIIEIGTTYTLYNIIS